MKQVKRRTWFCLVFTAILAAGLAAFLVLYVADGSDWASFRANKHIYDANGHLKKGTVRDVKGAVLYDASDGAYHENASVRKATLHAVGDRAGNIATGALQAFSGRIGGFNPVFGTTMSGHEIYLTLDADINHAAMKALNNQKGAIGVYNYQTGDILCMVSMPAFDPADPPEIRDGDKRYEGVYVNRFLSAAYTPGSVYKLVTTAAALERIPNVTQRSFTCTGRTEIDGNVITCPGVHGTMDVQGALANSCNGVYASLAVELGGDTLMDYASKAGLTESLSVDGVSCAKGSFDAAPAGSADLGWSGVGQYHDLVNPCAMMTYMGTIANGGTRVMPRLIARDTVGGIPVSVSWTKRTESGISSAACATLTEMMRNNVVNQYGQKQFGDLTVCAKSGTAEVGSNSRPHAWFTGFIDDERHPYAFVAVVENGGSGASAAGGAIAKVLKAMSAAGY